MSSNIPPIQPTLQQPAPPDQRTLMDAHKAEIMKSINCARPGIIQSYDAANQTVTVQIAQQKVTSTSPTGVRTLQNFTECVTVPVFFPCGGGFTLTFPIAVGDECILLFADRELDNWLFSGGNKTAPTTARFHDLSDAFALCGVRSFPRSLGGVSTDTTQLRSDDGLTFVEVAGGGIVNVQAPTEINLNSPIVNVAGIINIINENNLTDSCVINGEIKATGDIIAGVGTTNTSLKHHIHSGVQSGANNTGQPV